MIGRRLKSWFTESRAAADESYIDRLLSAQLAAAKGYGNVRGSAGYRSCLNLIDDAAGAAVVSGDHSAILQPRLGEIARALVDRGSSAWELLIGAGGRLELLPVEVTNVVGGAEEASWIYTLTRTGPSTTETVAREQAGVLNIRARPETRTSWRGHHRHPARRCYESGSGRRNRDYQRREVRVERSSRGASRGKRRRWFYAAISRATRGLDAACLWRARSSRKSCSRRR